MIATHPTELEQMKTLGELAEQARAILRDMEEAELAPMVRAVHDYAGRKGYSAQFLHGFEVPHPKPTGVREQDVAPLLNGSGTELKYEHFSVKISKSRRLALYVACNIDGRQSQKIKRGKDRWSLDPRMAQEYQIGEDLYAGNELDRGHLVRREDPIWGQKHEAAIAIRRIRDHAERHAFGDFRRERFLTFCDHHCRIVTGVGERDLAGQQRQQTDIGCHEDELVVVAAELAVHARQDVRRAQIRQHAGAKQRLRDRHVESRGHTLA